MAGMTCWRSGQRKRGLGLAGVAGSLGIEESLIGKPCQVLLESYLPVLYHLGIDSQTLRTSTVKPVKELKRASAVRKTLAPCSTAAASWRASIGLKLDMARRTAARSQTVPV